MSDDSYGRAWRSYSRWRRSFWGGFLALIVVAGVAPVTWPLITRMNAESFSVGVLVFSWLVMFVSAMQLIFFKCPRCHEYFSMKGVVFHAFTAKCANCALQKWSSGEPQVQPAHP